MIPFCITSKNPVVTGGWGCDDVVVKNQMKEKKMTTQMQIELNSQDKVSFDKLCERLGMTAQEAMQNFVIKMLDVGKLPFKADVPNERLKKLLNSKAYRSFATVDDLMEYLHNGDEA